MNVGTNSLCDAFHLLTVFDPGLVVDLYITLFDAILSNRPAGHGRDGYYFGENGENSLYDVCRAISQALVELGRGYSPEPTTLSVEENLKYFKVGKNIQGFCVFHFCNAYRRASRHISDRMRAVERTGPGLSGGNRLRLRGTCWRVSGQK